jgi:hypothetical protein
MEVVLELLKLPVRYHEGIADIISDSKVLGEMADRIALPTSSCS